MGDEFLFVAKYRPQTIDECILPDNIKTRFESMIRSGNLQNMIFSGGAGVGKTTSAIALCNDVKSPYLFVNASKESGIDTLRTQLTNFAESLSIINDNRKTIILDEGDGLSRKAQEALKSFIEKYSAHVGFIITCNNIGNIIDPIRSRMLNIDFNLQQNSAEIMGKYMKRLRKILEAEKIEYDDKVLAKLIQTFFPDLRKILDEIQGYCTDGKLDSGIFSTIETANVDKVYQLMRAKKWTELRDYLEKISTKINIDSFINDMYNSIDRYIVQSSRPEAVLIIHDHDKVMLQSVNKLITLVAMCTRIMIECDFKDE